MGRGNQTAIDEFIFLGLTNQQYLQVPLFLVFLMVYVTTLVGNLGMIMLITLDSRLHTPMYFFLSNLSLIDLGCSTSVTPKFLESFLVKRKTISYAGCATQMFFCGFFMLADCIFLAVMAYDRYVAICNPLLYRVIMSQRICVQLAGGSYIVAIIVVSMHVASALSVQLCSNMINHFFCDVPPILKLSCSSTVINEIVLFALCVFAGLSTMIFILISYLYILSSILRIRSAEGRRKAFSTCASHLMAITLFYGTMIFMYLRPASSYYLDQDKLVSLSYTVVIPMLNPLIYSLRNKEVKDASRRIIGKLSTTL
ncbi:olfactory receptor 5AR1-like [Emydura macquarii macquarii]|uniref:olfactory receptor 5AR1-like n=1 Tax=Emydura macquarii macquarii TaxID=1129001 RepID=UPI00352A6DC9